MTDPNKIIWRGWIGYYEGGNGWKYLADNLPPILFKRKKDVKPSNSMINWGETPLKAESIVVITRDEYNRLKELDHD